jgi:hypothetical protein
VIDQGRHPIAEAVATLRYTTESRAQNDEATDVSESNVRVFADRAQLKQFVPNDLFCAPKGIRLLADQEHPLR